MCSLLWSQAVKDNLEYWWISLGVSYFGLFNAKVWLPRLGNTDFSGSNKESDWIWYPAKFQKWTKVNNQLF